MQLGTHLESFLVTVKEHQAGGIADALISGIDEAAANNSQQWHPTSALAHLTVCNTSRMWAIKATPKFPSSTKAF